jgi:hypothetical protein
MLFVFQAEDLYDMNPKETTAHCEQLWEKAIEKEKRRLTNLDALPCVWRLLWDSFGIEYAKAAIYKPIWLIVVILQVSCTMASMQVRIKIFFS